MTRTEQNLQTVRNTIARAAEKSGRDPSLVKLVCVTKTVGIQEIQELFRLGERLMAENRVQEARKKIALIPSLEVEWHLIGHLQTNKVKQALDLFRYFHSVDSLRLAQELSRRASMLGIKVPFLIEVNVSGEDSKYGVSIETPEGEAQKEEPVLGVYDLVAEVVQLPGLDLQGLMTMAPLVDDPETVRPVFRRLRQIRDEINDRRLTPSPLRELSMGMSNDYPVAIEEGATFVRIGSALFA